MIRRGLLSDVPALAVGNTHVAIDVGPDAVSQEVLDAGIHSVVGGSSLHVGDGPHIVLMQLQHLQSDVGTLLGIGSHVQFLLQLDQLQQVAGRGGLVHGAVPGNVGGIAGNHGVGLEDDGDVADTGDGIQHHFDGVAHQIVIDVGAVGILEGALDAGSAEVGLQDHVGVGSAVVSNGHDVQHQLGTVGEGVEATIGSAEVSSLLQRIDGFSNVNLGNVADNLYMEMKLLENRGDVKLESTPKLATLNGHKASMSKGETIYYKEINTSYLGSQNPLQTSSYNWKSVDADLTIDITPHVSLDSLVTLEVDMNQSEFGTIREENAPPPVTKRSFKSIVRVADGDVVLLGGLDSATDSDSRDGLPWIARVPVLRWIFGSHRREKADTKMSIFIRAEIID